MIGLILEVVVVGWIKKRGYRQEVRAIRNESASEFDAGVGTEVALEVASVHVLTEMAIPKTLRPRRRGRRPRYFKNDEDHGDGEQQDQ